MGFPLSALADHLVAADITYKSLRGTQYEVTLTLYRDCGSATPLPNTQQVFLFSATTNPQQIPFSLNQVGDKADVTPVCARTPSTCQGGMQPGVERFIYRGTINLPRQARDWVLYFRDCRRSAAISTIRHDGNTCLYIEAGINNVDASINASPVFNTDAASFVCANADVSLSLGATDVNGNRLRFRLIAPRTNTVSPVDPGVVQFVPPFSATNPLPTVSGFALDSITGTFTFNATRSTQAVTALRVDEYDAQGRLIGYVMRDMQLIVQDCNNRLPALGGINGTPARTFTVCANAPVTLTFNATDADAADSLRVFANNTLPGTFNFFSEPGVGSTQGIATWTPTSADTGTRLLTLTVRDNSCPRVGITTVTYTIRVLPGPIVRLRSDTAITCGTRIPILARVSGGAPPLALRWLGRDDTTRLLNLSSGLYTVTVTDRNGCAAQAQVNLGTPDLAVSFRADSVCAGTASRLIPTVSGGLVGPSPRYAWAFPGGVTSGLVRPQFNFGPAGRYPVKLTVTGLNNCEVEVSRFITICEPPQVFPFITGARCQGDAIQLNVSAAAPGGPECAPIFYSLFLNNRGYAENANVPLTVPANLQVADTNRGIVTVVSRNGCRTQRPVRFTLEPKPQAAFSPAFIWHKCDRPDTVFNLKVWKPLPNASMSYRVTVSGLDTTFTTGPLTDDTVRFRIPVRRVQTVTCRAVFTNGCVQTIQAQVRFPFSGQITSTPYCRVGDTVRLRQSVSARWPIRYFRWNLANGDTSSLASPLPTLPADTAVPISLILRDSTGCRDTLDHTVSTRLPDTTAFIVVDTACFATRVAVRFRNPALVQQWRWFGTNPGDTALFNATSTRDSLLLTSPGRTPIGLRIRFKDVCVKTYTADTVFVRDSVGVAATVGQVCAVSPTQLSGLRTQSQYPIRRWYWNYNYPALPNLPAFPQDQGATVARTFNQNGVLRIRLTAYDAKGCPGRYVKDTATVLVSRPVFDIKGQCEKDSLFFFYGRVPDQYENISRFIYDFGDGTTQENANGQVYKVYPRIGRFMVKLTAITDEGCRNTDSSLLDLKPKPAIVFGTNPNPCSNSNILLDATASRSPGDTGRIVSYIWLQDGLPLVNTQGQAAAGPREVVRFTQTGPTLLQLVIVGNNGCRDSLALPLQVREGPIAGFTYNLDELGTDGSLLFRDSTRFVTNWRWRFGDGDSLVTSQATDPRHAYRQSGRITVTQIVTNPSGCADTATARLELRSFVALPSAFSPNGDGNNDALELRHRFLRQLTHYEVYNRFGQVVFSTTNPNQTWDGKLNGAEAPVGNYVYVVRAKSIFGEDLALRGNLQLIR